MWEALMAAGAWFVILLFVFSVLLLVAPLAIWHNVASTKLEARRAANAAEETLAVLKEIESRLAKLSFEVE